jgi:lipopolysaccharide transport system permease protein
MMGSKNERICGNSFMLKSTSVLWSYRGFIYSSMLNELKVTFARSRLGFFWMILQPLSQVLIYALVLSNVLRAKLPGVEHQYGYVFYLMSGTLGWSLVQEMVTRNLSLFIERANLMKKMSFPKVILVATMVGMTVLNHLILFTVTILVFILMKFPLVWSALIWMPVFMLLMTTFSFGLGLVFGVLNVFIRDLTYMVPIFLQLLFWATPIVYPVSILPARFQSLLAYNPLIYLIKPYQEILLYGRTPTLVDGLFAAGIAMSFLTLGWWMFRRASAEMVDVL